MMNPSLLCYEFHVRKTKDAIQFIMCTGECAFFSLAFSTPKILTVINGMGLKSTSP